MDWNNAVLAGSSFYTTLKIFLLQIYFERFVGFDSESGITHNQNHFNNLIIFVIPKNFQFCVCEWHSVLIVLFLFDLKMRRIIFICQLINLGKGIHLMKQ